ISGGMLASGYMLDPVQTAGRFVVEDGIRWYLSSDRAQLEEGQVTLLGRNDDIFISGGVKVSLSELSEVVKSLRGLATAETVTMPDGRWGTVSVVAADGRTRMVRLTLEQLRQAVTEQLGEAAAPRQLIYFDEGLPLLDSGKPDILRIRQEIGEEPRERS
ncbi:MAG: acyl-CoA synthetase, partial [Microbacteriaceae bacterium]